MAGTCGLEIDTERIGLCRIRQASRGLTFKRGASLPLPPGLVTPSLTEPNVAEEEALTAELRRLLKKAGWRRGPVVLTLPDLSCRIGFQDFEELGGTPAEMRQLLSWRLKDRLPFPIQEARLDYQPVPSPGNGTRLLYLLTREAIVAQYETVLATVGLEPVRIITRGVALYRLSQAAGIGGKRLLFAPGPSSLVLIYAEQGTAQLWRVLPWDDHGTAQDRIHRAERLLQELRETIGYLRETMGVGEPDGLLLMGGGNQALAETVTKGCQLPVHTMPEPGDGFPVDLLTPGGAALLQQAWRPGWISP
ncbi:MAG: type IV pilus biogenesis protein PilM [Candidatus Methylomirabilales bacterium]